MLPDEADPLDVRYNVIQWVHRSTRGWSYGSSITDPRTGEIIKGHVSLGSLRIRQDFLIAQALMNKPFAERDDNYQPMLDIAIARIRQLSAHEIGHTLGFSHNYAASTTDKSSVMDYPHPQFSLVNGEIDFSKAYETGIGDWDKVTVAYSYQNFSKNDEKKGLNAILEKAKTDGLRYITDQDARPQGSAHVLAHLWDNGAEVSKELDEMLRIRKTAINNFSVDNIQGGTPYSVLEDVFVPLYFYHRYQTEGVAKIIGGLEYNYAVKGDGQQTVAIANKAMQQEALKSVLKTLDATEIAIPKDKLRLFPPRAFGTPRTRESKIDTANHQSLGHIGENTNGTKKGNNMGLEEVVNELILTTINKKHKDAYLSEAQTTINFRVLFHIMNLAGHKEVHPQVNAIASQKLKELSLQLAKDSGGNPIHAEMIKRIKEFYDHPELFKVIPSPKIPDGSPIGMGCFH